MNRLILGSLAALAVALSSNSSSATDTCVVTVFFTDPDGNIDPSKAPEQRPCRPGETNNGTEYYNPYKHTFVFQPTVPLVVPGPVTQTPPGTFHGSNSSSTVTCIPTVRGQKVSRATPLNPGKNPCPGAPSGATPGGSPIQ